MSQVGTDPTRRASVVIPAHNEQHAISRLLTSLLKDASPGEFEIVVVCNGCTDDTAGAARRASPGLRLVETPVPSKTNALRIGDGESTLFPRLYIDADIELSTAGARAIVAALSNGRHLAAAPERVVATTGVSGPVRHYYRVWQSLPHVQQGLFGRGVVAVSQTGHARISALPALMSDDLAASQAFAAHERTVVHDAVVVVYPPRTLRALVRRRTRSVTGNVQLERAGITRDDSRTSVSDLSHLVRRAPELLPGVAIFLCVAVAARLSASRQIRRGDFTTWLRDDSREREA